MGGVVNRFTLHFGADDPLEPLQHLLVFDFELVEDGKHLLVQFDTVDALTGMVAFVVDRAAIVLVFASAFALGLAEDRAPAVTAGNEAVAVDRVVPVVGFVAEKIWTRSKVAKSMIGSCFPSVQLPRN